MFRRYVAIALVLVLGFLYFPQLFNSYVSQGQLNAPVIELRSPLEAVVVEPVALPTGRFEVQAQPLLQLRARVAEELTALASQEHLLLKRLDQFIAHERDRLRLELQAREAELRRADVDRAAAVRDLERQTMLVDSGFISAGQVDAVRHRHDAAQVNQDIANAHLARARANLHSLETGGFLAERSGGTDVSYTQQKLDDVRLRIAQMRAVGNHEQPRAGAVASLVSIHTPGAGLLMGPSVSPGAFVAAGDTLAHYVLCTQSFIDLLVPVMELSNYRVGESVEFRVSGEWTFYRAQVAQVFPMHTVTDRLKLAVQNNMARDVAATGRVWLSPEPAFEQRITQSANCMIGQKVHARLPRQQGWLSRWGSFLADVL